MNFTPTAEQQHIVDVALTGKDVIVQAYAGASKTSTLCLVAEAIPDKRILYVAFNKAIATEAAEKMPSNVTSRTVHSVAYGKTDKAILRKLKGSKPYNPSLVKELGVSGFEAWDGKLKETIWLSELRLVGWVSKTVLRYVQSSDESLSLRHVYIDPDYKHLQMDGLKEMLLAPSIKLWNRYIDKDDNLTIPHDVYLKLFSLSKIDLGYDVVMLDEHQDTSGVMLNILASQKSSQKVYVGDSFQKIYSFTGSVDISNLVNAEKCYLTKSFRFGDGVAQVANSLLKRLGAEKPLEGNGTETTFDEGSVPDAIICRTNAGVLEQYISSLIEFPKAKINITCDTAAILNFAQAMKELDTKGKTYHKYLRGFKSPNGFYHWLKTTDEDVEPELANLAALTKKVGVNNIVEALGGYYDHSRPTLTITTAHKAKGLEWDNVHISSDFPVPRTESDEEYRLFYVACTRAKKNLSGLIHYQVQGMCLSKDSNGYTDFIRDAVRKEIREAEELCSW